MHVATWAIQERERVLSDAKARLPRRTAGTAGSEARIEDLVDVAHRAFVARLSGGAVHPGTVDELRGNFGAAALITAAQAVADALRALAEKRGAEPATLQGERAAISDALDELLALFDPDGGDPLDIDVVEARPTLVHALSELAKSAPSMLESAPRALLRVRASSASSARALESARIATLASSTGLLMQPSAPDELLLGVVGDEADAVARLVRGAGMLASAAGAAASQLSFALVLVDAGGAGDGVDGGGGVDGDGGVDVLAAIVRAGALLTSPGLLVLDEGAWSVAGAGLAAVPGVVRTVEPIAAFGHDRWEQSALLARPPLMGRDDERARLTRHLIEPSANDAPVLVCIHGAAGVGKTSLVRAALASAGFDDDNAAVLWGAADALSPTPYAAFAAMLRALAGAPAGHRAAAERIRRLVFGLAAVLPDREAAELTSLLPVVVTLLGAGDDDSGADVDDRSTRALRTSLRRALLLVAEGLLARCDDGRPAVFVVPGADSIDGPTRDALAFVAARLGGRARVVLLSSTRLKLPPAFEGVFRAERIELGGLSAAVARELCGALLDRPGDDDELGALVEKARGSPLALAHAVRFAVEGGLLRRRDDRWDAGELDPKDIPGRLDRLLRGRVERLPADARRLLAGCATLGLTLLPAAVEFIGVRLGLSREEVARALSFLVDTGFLVRTSVRPAAPVFRDGDDDDRSLAFEHPLMRAAAAAAVADDKEKQRLHGFAADALEAVVPSGMHALAPSLARHHRLAGRPAAALERLAVAVRRSARLDDRQGAVALAREGLELAGDDAQAAFPFLLELCAIKDDGSRAQREALRALVRAADKTGDDKCRGVALMRVARFDLATGDLALAEDAALRAAAALVPRTDDKLAAHALRLLALVRFHKKDLDGAAAALVAARARTTPNDRRGLAALEQHEGLVHLERGDAVGAVERLLLARAHRVAIADVGGEAACLDGIAGAYVRQGRAATALALLESAVRLRDKIGDGAGRAQSKKALADVLLAVGDKDAALASAFEARKLAREHGLDRLEISAALTSVRVHLARGEAQAAEALLESVRRRARDALASSEVSLLGARAKLLRASTSSGVARDRAIKSALARAQEASAVAEEHGLLAAQIPAMAAAAEALLEDGDGNAALAWAQRAAELLDDPAAALLPVEDVLGVYARVLDAVGDDEEAAAVRARAAAILEERCARLPLNARERFWSTPARAALRASRAAAAQ